MNHNSIEKEFYLDLLYLFQMSYENKTTACLFMMSDFLGKTDYGEQLEVGDGDHFLQN